MHEARYYKKEKNSIVKCLLCPHECTIAPGKSGICKVRANLEGTLNTLVYGRVAAIHNDPVEKKPLYHFFPGKEILSIGEVGCNFSCPFCQNSSISQCPPNRYREFRYLSAPQIATQALSIPNNIGVAYTYNEPFTFYEFLIDCAKEVHNAGLKNVVVSNGFINPGPLDELLPHIDAFNIDLKAFNNEFYKKYVKGSLKPVLKTLKTIAHSGKHLEVTNLVITGINDDEAEFERMAQWVSNELGRDTPFHISRYYPVYRMGNPATPIHTLEKFYSIASCHLDYVYLGNVFDEKRSSTYCPHCSALLIQRSRFSIKINMDKNKCVKCGNQVRIKI